MKANKIILLVLAIATLGSCTKRIDLELNNEEFKRLVVEGWFTDQAKAHQVRLTWTASYYANEAAAAVSGATVSISDGTNTWPLTEQPIGSGNYFTDPSAAGSSGNTYTLTVEHEGQTWTASDAMEPVADLDSLALEFVPGELNEFGEYLSGYWAVKFWFQETAGTGDFYRWRTLVNGQTSSDTLRRASFSDDVLYDGSYIEDIEIDFLDSADVLTGDIITLEQHGISEKAYDVIIAVLTETDWRGGLFDAAPANVPTNVSNSGIGFFGAASVSEKSVQVP